MLHDYLVRWEIDIRAATPEEAAKKARLIQLNPESCATVFDVIAGDSETRIDLYPEDEG